MRQNGCVRVGVRSSLIDARVRRPIAYSGSREVDVAETAWPADRIQGFRLVHGKVLIPVAVIIASVAYLLVTALGSTAVYYVTVGELLADPSMQGQPVRVAGNVVPGSIQRDPASLLMQFEATDGSGTIPVVYRGVVPDIFGDNVEVVVEGKYGDGGAFNAGTLLAKCPSKFESA
ncbi:MAG: cytochrome c maturation protein CcmE [Chloroflexi bacterium]|nr:cytochrome c maturation protein CcmE [Chloroflexota bacterium]